MPTAFRLLPGFLCFLVLGSWGCSKGDSVGTGGSGEHTDASVVIVLLDASQGGISGSGGIAGGGRGGGASGGATGNTADAGPKPGCTGPLKVADPALEAAIRAELDLPTGDILPSHVATLTTLDAS